MRLFRKKTNYTKIIVISIAAVAVATAVAIVIYKEETVYDDLLDDCDFDCDCDDDDIIEVAD